MVSYIAFELFHAAACIIIVISRCSSWNFDRPRTLEYQQNANFTMAHLMLCHKLSFYHFFYRYGPKNRNCILPCGISMRKITW